MKNINATTIGNLISAHYEGDNEKFDSYVQFIIKAYEEQGEQRKADIIRKRADGSYKNQPKVVLDNDMHCWDEVERKGYHEITEEEYDALSDMISRLKDCKK